MLKIGSKDHLQADFTPVLNLLTKTNVVVIIFEESSAIRGREKRSSKVV